MKKRKIIIYLLILIFILFVICIYISKNVIEQINYVIKNVKIQNSFDDFKILQLSDLHNKEFGKNNEKLIQKINSVSPNIIVMTGDMLSASDSNYSIVNNLIKQLSLNYPIYYVLGNHEQDIVSKNGNKLIKILEESGAIVLSNEKICIEKNGQKINIYGFVPDMSSYKNSQSMYTARYGVTDKYINNVLGKCNKEEYNILLVHNPLYYDEYVKWGADLVLSGHVHGGIVRLPIVGGLLSPEVNFFPKYSKGKYDNNNTNLIVSAGLGEGRLKIRLFNRPHIPNIILKCDD